MFSSLCAKRADLPCSPGNLGQLLGTQSWDFHTDISEKYGPVVKMTGLFGVGAHICLLCRRNLTSNIWNRNHGYTSSTR